MIRTTIRAAAALLLLFAATGADAAQVVYEPFNYQSGAALNGQNGGIGFAGPWSASASSSIASGSLTTSGRTSTGNSAQYSDFSGAVTFESRNLSSTYGTDGSSLWVSFVNRVDSISAYEGLGFNTAGNTFGGLHVGVLGGPQGLGPPSATWGMDTIGGGTPLTSSVPVVLGQSTVLVLHMSFLSGADQVDLYVNPSPTQIPAAPDLTKSDLNFSVSSILIDARNTTTNFDEIRFGNTYADVAGVPEPSAWLLGACGLVGLARFAAKRVSSLAKAR